MNQLDFFVTTGLNNEEGILKIKDIQVMEVEKPSRVVRKSSKEKLRAKANLNKKCESLDFFTIIDSPSESLSFGSNEVQVVKKEELLNTAQKASREKSKAKAEFKKECEFLKESYERHCELVFIGGSDPLSPDGVNLSLVRNHIIVTKRKLKEFKDKFNFVLPEEFRLDVPPEYPKDYLAPDSESGINSSIKGRTYTTKELIMWRKELE